MFSQFAAMFVCEHENARLSTSDYAGSRLDRCDMVLANPCARCARVAPGQDGKFVSPLPQTMIFL